MTNQFFIKAVWIAIVFTVAIGITLRAAKEFDELGKTVSSVCLSSGFTNWKKVVKNKDGSYTVTCYDKQWQTVTFEM